MPCRVLQLAFQAVPQKRYRTESQTSSLFLPLVLLLRDHLGDLGLVKPRVKPNLLEQRLPLPIDEGPRESGSRPRRDGQALKHKLAVGAALDLALQLGTTSVTYKQEVRVKTRQPHSIRERNVLVAQLLVRPDVDVELDPGVGEPLVGRVRRRDECGGEVGVGEVRRVVARVGWRDDGCGALQPVLWPLAG